MQALFYMDMRQNISLEALELFRFCFELPENREDLDSDFFLEITRGVMQNRSQIDGIIERFSDNWKISRMGCVDRNVMRTATYEMLFREDIPFKVSINEAIDIGKRFGTEESGAFINGILDSIHNALKQKEIRPEFEINAEIPRKADEDEDGLPESNRKTAEPDRIPFSPVRGRPGVVRRRAPVIPTVSDEE